MARCLLIDDSRLARRICRAMLEKLGHSVSEAEEGEAGLKAYHAGRYDFIMVDQNMPLIGGTEFIRRLRNLVRDTEIPVVLCSSDADPLLVRKALRSGANAYLNKPYTEGALIRRLRRLQIS